MAFYNDEDEENNQQDPNAPLAVQPSGGSAFVGTGSGAQETQVDQASQPALTPDKPGNFVGIQQYLDQNKVQSGKLAERVGGFVDKQGSDANDSINQAGTKFNQEVSQQVVPLDQQLLDQAKTDASKIANDAAQKEAFNKMYNASYNGPNSIEQVDYWQPVMQAVGKANQAGENTNSVEGRGALLTDVRSESKGRGAKVGGTLDNALLSASPDSKQILSGARDRLKSVGTNLDNLKLSSGNQVTDVKSQIDATRNKAKDSLTEGWKGLETELAERERVADAEAEAEYNALVESLITGNYTDEQLGALGLSRGDKTYGASPNEYLSYQDRIDRQGVATAEDLARQAAIRDLSGGNIDFGQDLINSGAGVGQKGSNFDFNKSDFENAQSQSISNYENTLNTAGENSIMWSIPTIEMLNTGKEGSPNIANLKNRSLGEAIAYYEDMAGTGGPGGTLTRTRDANTDTANWYLNNYLYPARARLAEEMKQNTIL